MLDTRQKNKGYKKHEISLDNKKLTCTFMYIVLFLVKMSDCHYLLLATC